MIRSLPSILVILAACRPGGVPAALEDIEAEAEHAYDVALAEDYAALADAASVIDAAWIDYRPTAEADGAGADVLSAVDDAIVGLTEAANVQGGPAVAGRAANAVSEHMPELYTLYGPKVPTEVLALDYQGREIVLDGMDVAFEAAAIDVEALSSTWDAVRPAVVDAGGDAEAADFDASVERLRGLAAGQDAAGLIDEANVNLELVDVLEGVF